MTSIKSSVISHVDYDESTQRLEVTFHTGNVYSYTEVPAQVYRDFMRAESPGRYFHRKIRPVYQGTHTQQDEE